MICPVCGGEIYTDWPCFKCGTTYDEIISSISHPQYEKADGKGTSG